MTIQDLYAVLVRRKRTLVITFCLVVLLSAVAFIVSTRLYKSTAVIQVQKDSADALSLGTYMGTDGTPGDALESNVTLQTQARILQSESLALQVVQELHLENSPDFRSHLNPIGWLIGKLSPSGVPDPTNVSLEDAPGRRDHVVSTFEKRLKVKPIAGTRLIEIEYLSTNPHTAAAVVNQLVNDLVDFNFVTRQGATQKASEWLTKQLSDLRAQTEQKQATVVALQRGSGVFSLGQSDSQGHEQLYTPELDRLQKATAALSDAQGAVIIKGSLYQVVKSGDPELISGLAGNGMMTGASPGIAGSLTLLQNLRSQQAQVQAELDELSAKFGPGYSKLAEKRANLASINQAIAGESNRIAARAKNDYTVAQQIEAKDQAVYDEEKSQADLLNNKTMQYEIVRQDADRSRNLYENLVQRLKGADLVAGLRSSNITVVDPARTGSRPAKPSILWFGLGGIMGGAILAICGGLLRDSTDRRIMDLSELQLMAAGPPIGYLPFHKRPKKPILGRRGRSGLKTLQAQLLTEPIGSIRAQAMIAATEPRSLYTEAVRALRTSLMRNGYGQSPRVLLVTSSIAGEGKSLMSLNLAITYAQSGKRVLLVDGDLRTPVIGDRLNVHADRGLSELLSPENPGEDPHPVTLDLPGNIRLDVIPAGSTPAYPAELIGSERMMELVNFWRLQYDVVVIDGAPLLPVTDSALLSHLVDYTLIVARHRMTDRRSIERSWSILQDQGVRNAGIVLNGIKASGGSQYSYYGHKPLSPYGRESHA